jgi:hypothetical protein
VFGLETDGSKDNLLFRGREGNDVVEHGTLSGTGVDETRGEDSWGENDER